MVLDELRHRPPCGQSGFVELNELIAATWFSSLSAARDWIAAKQRGLRLAYWPILAKAESNGSLEILISPL